MKSTPLGIVFGGGHDWARIDANGSPISPPPRDFGNHPIYGAIADEIIDDQHMVRVPAFFYRAGLVPDGPYAGKKALWVSATREPGFSLHPAFRNPTRDISRFWIGKYQGTPDGALLGSQPGLMPLTGIDFPAMQRAAARGEGWMLWSIYQLAAIQTLALIEMGTPDMQSAIGMGHVRGGGAAEVDDARVLQASWRGITGLWGNVWQMVDGLQTDDDGEYTIWDTNGAQMYVATEVPAPSGGWFHRRSTERGMDFDLGAAFLPASTRENREDSAFGDYCWALSRAVAYHGGHWGGGALAGLFNLYVLYAASHAHSRIGGRLAKVE